MGDSVEDSNARLRSCRTLDSGIAMVAGQSEVPDPNQLDEQIKATGLCIIDMFNKNYSAYPIFW